MTNPDLARRAAEFLQARWEGFRPRTLVALGSGLGDACREMSVRDEVAFDQVPGFAPPSVAGHAGRLRVGAWSGEPVLVLLGRMHLYEGHSVERVVHPIHTAARLGVCRVVLTNMSGGAMESWHPPALASVDGHLDLQHGWVEGFRGGVVDCYSDVLRRELSAAAADAGVNVHRGVYAGMLGPSYETPAEVRALRTLGCQMVGMSTVKEAQASRDLGLDCCAVSCVSNFAAGVTDRKVDHGDVVEAGRRIAPSLIALLGAFLKRLSQDDGNEQPPA